MDKMSILMVCLMAALSEAALHEFSLQNVLDNAELMDHARRVARAADAAGYEIATLYGESLESGEHRRPRRQSVVKVQKLRASPHFRRETTHVTSEAASSMPKPESGGALGERNDNQSPIDQRLLLQWPSEGQVGAIQSKDRNFQLLPLPEDFTRKFPFLHVLLTWSNTTDNQDSSPVDNFVDVSKDEVNKLEDEEANNEKVKRSVRDRKVTIEVGVYLDVHFLNKVSEKHQISSNQQLTDFIAQKWSGIAGVLHNPSLVGWDITIKVVNVEIWRSNPWWYQDSTQELGERMQSACENTMDQPFDYVSIETSDTDPPRRTGVAYVGQMCNPRYRCGITKGANFNFAPEIHEMGHNMGLKHDDTMSECSRQEKGFMSAKQSVFRPCYAKVLDYSLRDKSCLFEDSVDTSNYNPINLE
ncbi:hypothetical protein C0Q70_03710 [Pomacea canaliculata]|uniref:Peptidase M12B domain-containing protein n=1 Tax=Pomacea canaliculata TaxID=400727 RepID=A0A2T7PTH3_POMCA|nr:hypothetical protein C0Q70_03710 [Pomacea canaliculata]